MFDQRTPKLGKLCDRRLRASECGLRPATLTWVCDQPVAWAKRDDRGAVARGTKLNRLADHVLPSGSAVPCS